MKYTYRLLFMLSLLPASLQLEARHYGDFLHEKGNDVHEDSVNHDFNSLADVMKMIAQHKAQGTYDGSTPLHYLANGDESDAVELQIAKELMQSHPEFINDQNNENQESPLHVAADSENFELIKALINAGAKVNAQDVNGRTALHYIAFGDTENDANNLKIARFLIDHGADLSIIDAVQHEEDGTIFGGLTAADIAAKYNTDLKMKKLLADALASEKGNDVDEDSGSFDFNSLADVMKMIAKHKAQGTYDGSTPLHYLAEGDNNDQVNLKLVKELIQSHPEFINDQNNENRESPLHVAVDLEHFELVELLINAGAKVNAQDLGGRTPLHYIVFENYHAGDANNLKIAQFLIKHGADVSLKDNDGKNVRDIAIEQKAEPALRSLLSTLKNLNM
ncbi:ankyrin repeat domain-containing protein [Candidatus Chromulinivorax destructor]|uniref:Uncharacterized protein n=1 Tax=Candidatus Chromulinivorax destructor TaxID=2066483 RepID=A0A345ZBG8_9BACT|nr:ankyrin repeat domain-containing protein [Candidatus Chromulinivorax destructor]AXK60635.1 hypothetical protein C0J27_02660 [Candidatus Chromulinivorax destructor]